MNKTLLLVAIPLLVILFLIIFQPSNSNSTNVTATTSTTVPSEAGKSWSEYSTYAILLGVIIIAVWYFNKKTQFLQPSYKEEEIMRLLRGWLSEHNSMVLGEVSWVEYKPLINPKLVQIIFKVKVPEALSTSFCYVEFYKGRFRGLKKGLTQMTVEDLTGIRLIEAPDVRIRKELGTLDKFYDRMTREGKKGDEK